MIPKIRKQPKRKTKKYTQKTIKNPFKNNLPMYLPESIGENLILKERISLFQIATLVSEQSRTEGNHVNLMKQAIQEQEIRMSSLPRYYQAKISSTKDSHHLQEDLVQNWEYESKLGLPIDLGDHWNILNDEVGFFG